MCHPPRTSAKVCFQILKHLHPLVFDLFTVHFFVYSAQIAPVPFLRGVACVGADDVIEALANPNGLLFERQNDRIVLLSARYSTMISVWCH
jgi:hypothetical protein